MDCPKDFKLMRDRLVEMIFTCKATRCSACNKVQLAFPNETKMNLKGVSNYSDAHAQPLTDDIKEESFTVREALRIKGILDNYEQESDSVLFDSLRRLQLMDFSFETLKATQIGKPVTCLRNHGSEQIKHLACTLIQDWKAMINEWFEATEATTEAEKEEEEGLPSPPLD